MQSARIPLIWRGSEQAGFLVQAINSINRSVFVPMPQPPESGNFVCVVPVHDYWRLSKPWCEREGVPHFSAAIEDPLIRALRRDSARLLFDLSNEGPEYSAGIFDELRGWLAANKIPPRQTAFVSQNRALPADYRDATGDCDTGFLIFDAYIVDAYLSCLRQAKSPTQRPPDASTEASAPFVCLNYSPRPHRVCLLLALLRNGALDQGLVSFRGLETEKYSFTEADIARVAELARRLPGVIELLPELRRRGRLIIDQFSEGGNALAGRLDEDLHRRGHTVVVSESDFSEGSIRRVTEKTIKPIFAERPFIIFGNPHSMALVRELGFQTFHPLIDETYDEAENPELRLFLIDRVIAGIVARNPTQLHELSMQAREICAFNRRLLTSGGALSRYWDLHVAPLLHWVRGST